MFTIPSFTRTQADGRYVRKNAAQVSATDFAAFGATPPSTGAVRVDASSFGGIGASVTDGTRIAALGFLSSTAFVGTTSPGSFDLVAENSARWRVATTAAISSLGALQTTARIIGGPTNGLGIRNSANTQDNVSFSNDGLTVKLGEGTPLVQLGGTTSLFPAIKRQSADVRFRNAADTGDAGIVARVAVLSGAAAITSAGFVSLGSTTQTTVGAAGAASALPATPSGYLRFFLGATEFVLPYYAQA